MESLVHKSAVAVSLVFLFVLSGCLTGPAELPEESGEGPCSYELLVDDQRRNLKGACPPLRISALWKSFPAWFQDRFRFYPDEVLRNKLRLYSGPGISRTLIIDGKRYDLVSPDLIVRSETQIMIE
ncbi:MAG: hypothetical protein RH862_15325 [Leptospiraceae bacterium]